MELEWLEREWERKNRGLERERDTAALPLEEAKREKY